MDLFLRKPRCNVFAEGVYYPETGSILVKQGARVSEDIREYKSKAASTVADARKEVVENNILIKDLLFKSPSGAAVFVTGRSTNGLVAWKDENGVTLNELLGKDESI